MTIKMARLYATDVGGGSGFFSFYSCFVSSNSIVPPLPILIPILRPSPSCPLLPVCLLELVPRPRAWEAQAVRAICGGGRAGCLLAFSFPRSALSLAARSLLLSCSVFPSTWLYDNHVLNRFRLSPAGVAWCLLLRIVCGEQMGTVRLSDVAPYAFPSCLVPFPGAIRQSVPAHAFRFPCRSACLLEFSSHVPSLFCSCCGWRSLSLVPSSVISAPLLVSPGGAVGRVVFACLLRSCRSVSVSFLSSARSFLARYRRLAHPVPVPVADTVSVPYPAACLVCSAAYGHGRRPRPSCAGMGLLLASLPSCSPIVLDPFIVSCCCPFCFSPLFAPSCDTVGGELPCGVSFSCGLVARSRCLPSLRRGGSFSCPHGVLSSLVVRRRERHAVWIVWLCGLFAVLVVY